MASKAAFAPDLVISHPAYDDAQTRLRHISLLSLLDRPKHPHPNASLSRLTSHVEPQNATAMGDQRSRTSSVVTSLEEGTTPPLDPEANGAAWAGGRSRRWRRWRVESPRGVLVLATTIKFAVTLSGMMVILPFFRLLEDAFCHRHFGDTSPGFIEEKECKVPEVQKDLVFLMGWLMLVTGLVGEFWAWK